MDTMTPAAAPGADLDLDLDGIQRFFHRYAGALAARDVEEAMNCLAVPAFVVRAHTAGAATSRDDLRRSFKALFHRYDELGLGQAVPRLLRVESLGADLTCADVRWVSLDRLGSPTPRHETYRYVLRRGPRDWHIQVTIDLADRLGADPLAVSAPRPA